jgi:hypothetical protein
MSLGWEAALGAIEARGRGTRMGLVVKREFLFCSGSDESNKKEGDK